MKEASTKADRPEYEGRRQYHINVTPGEIAPYVLLPGDPGRVDRIVKSWETGRVLSFNREYKVATGTCHGCPISAISSGIGSPSLGIAVEEAAQIGCHTFVRVGSTGAIQENIEIGDLMIDQAAVRFEGTSHQYVFGEYPAFASLEVTLSLVEAAEELGYRYHLGLNASTDSFYVGQARPGFHDYLPAFQKERFEELRNTRVTNYEMEPAALFVISSLYGLRSGVVSVVIANRITNRFSYEGEDKAIAVANKAVQILQDWDRRKKERGKSVFWPGLLKT